MFRSISMSFPLATVSRNSALTTSIYASIEKRRKRKNHWSGMESEKTDSTIEIKRGGKSHPCFRRKSNKSLKNFLSSLTQETNLGKNGDDSWKKSIISFMIHQPAYLLFLDWWIASFGTRVLHLLKLSVICEQITSSSTSVSMLRSKMGDSDS